MGLGIILAGGLNREGGPHIYIDRILAGMDAAKVSYMIALCTIDKFVILMQLSQTILGFAVIGYEFL